MGRSHIGKGGIARPCIAMPGNCPYGGAEAHWDSPEEAMAVANSINMQLSNLDGFGVAKVDGYAVPNAYAERAILRLANFDEKLKKMESYKNKARAKILAELLDKGIKSIDTGDVRATFISGGTIRRSIDAEKFHADETMHNHIFYQKESMIDSAISFENTDVRTQSWSKRNADTSPDFKFNIIDGQPDEASALAIKALGQYEAKIKELTQTRNEVRSQIKEAMEDKDVSVLKVGKIELTVKPAHIRRTIDTKALRDDGIYDNYVKETITSNSIRMTYRNLDN